MKNQNKTGIVDKIDHRAVTILLIVTVIEFELFVFAKGVVAIAKQDAWISVLLANIITALTTYLMIKLASRFPKENYFQYNKKVWGKTIAFLIAISYLIYWAVYLVMIIEDTVYANKFFFLRETPSFITLLFFGIGAAWLVPYGLTAIVRFFQLLFPFMITPLFLIFVVGIRSLDISQFQPVLKGGIMPVLKGALYFAGVQQGFEIILFLSPFMKDIRNSMQPALVGVGFLTSISFMQTFFAIGILGVSNIKYSVFPGIDTISVIEFPGFAVERFELFLTFPWIIGVFTTICIFIYLLSYGAIQLLNLKNKKLAVYITTGVVAASTYVIPNFAIQEKLRGVFNYFTLFFVFFMPVLTLLVSIIRSKRDTYE